MKTRFLLILTIVLCILPLLAFAATTRDGIYDYTVLEDGTAELTKCNKDSATVKIPAEVDGIPVSKIGDRLFYGSKKLQKVTIPEGIREIGESAFLNCSKLAELSLPQSIVTIGNSAFQGTGLTGKIVVRNGVTYGEEVYFETKVTSVQLEEGVTTIPAGMFGYCKKLANIKFCSTLETIGSGAFRSHNAQKIVFPASLKKIEESAFMYNSKCVYDLSACMDVEFVTMKDEYTKQTVNTSINGGSVIYAVGSTVQELYEGSKSAKAAPIPKDKTVAPADPVLKDLNYTRNDKVYHLVIPEGVETIAAGTFRNLSTLVSVELPSTLKEIGEEAFYKCTNLKTVKWPAAKKGVTPALTKIVAHAFSLCSSLEEVTLPDTVTSLGDAAFFACTSLKTLKLSAGLTEIPSLCFYGNMALTKLEIPEGVTNLELKCFAECRNLKTLKLPKSLIRIGHEAFDVDIDYERFANSYGSHLTSMKTLTIPANVEEIGIGAFAGRDALTTITIEKNSRLKSIGEAAFLDVLDVEILDLSGCTQLEKVDDIALVFMQKLKTLKLPAQEITFGEAVLNGTEKVTVSVVQDSSADAWLKKDYPDIKVKYRTK